MTPRSGAGTTEAAWLSWQPLRDLPRLDLAAVGHAVVVAALPDDATLAAGGTLALLARLAVPCDLVVVTDGGRPTSVDDPAAGADEPGLREDATRLALARLELGTMPVHRLALPAGAAAASEERMTAVVEPLLGHASWCLAPWPGDGDPDREAAGRAAAAACAARGATLLAYVVGAWQWARPDDPRLPWADAARVDLPLEIARRKAAALEAFTTPTAGARAATGVPDETLDHFRRPYELFLR